MTAAFRSSTHAPSDRTISFTRPPLSLSLGRSSTFPEVSKGYAGAPRLTGTQASPPNVVHADEHCILGTFRNLAIAIWHNDTHIEALRILGGVLPRLAAQFPDGIGLVQIVGEQHPPLRADARGELNRVLRGASSCIRCSTVVFEGQGFRAAAVRGIAAGMVMLMRVPFPHRVFGSLSLALDTQVANLPLGKPKLDQARLTQAITSLRQRFERMHLPRSA